MFSIFLERQLQDKNKQSDNSVCFIQDFETYVEFMFKQSAFFFLIGSKIAVLRDFHA